MNELKDYSNDGINKLKKLIGVVGEDKLGKELLKFKSIEEEFRINYLNEVCSGERNTPEYREIANAFLDFQEKKINKATFESVKKKYSHLL